MSKSRSSKGFFGTIASWFGRGSKKDKADKRQLTSEPVSAPAPAPAPAPRKWQSRSMRDTRGPPPSLASFRPEDRPGTRRRSQRDDQELQVDLSSHENFNERSVDEARTGRPTAGAEASGTSSAAVPRQIFHSQAHKREIAYAVDRGSPDYLLEKAVDFVKAGGDVHLKFHENVDTVSPLLIFCKHDGRIHDDVDNALKRNRGGKDVLLVVVTENKHLKLPDSSSLRAFGQVVCLYWDPAKRKFRYSENYDSMVWVRDFLESFKVEVNIQFTRTASYRKSFRGVSTKGNVKGYYHVLSPGLEKEAVLSTVLHLQEEHVELQRVPRDQAWPRPLVLLCQAGDDLEAFVSDFMYRNRLDKKDLVVVVMCPVSHLHVYGHAPGLPSFLRLRMDDVRPRLSDKAAAENRTVATTVKNFLKKNSRPQDPTPVRRTEEMTSRSGQLRAAHAPPSRDRDTSARYGRSIEV